MVRTRRSGVAAALAAGLLLALAAGTASAAGRPGPQYAFTACWNGTNVSMTQTWSGFNVDAYGFGFGDSSGSAGFGDSLPHPSRHGSVFSITATSELTVPPDATFVTGGLAFNNQNVANDQIDVPAGGWSALAAC